jgi:lysophospholipase L1-like esterase
MSTVSGSPHPTTTRAAIWAPRIVTSCAFLLSLGFLFHHSPYPILLGRYNGRYLAFLFAVFFVFLPLVYFTVRFFCVSHELKRSRGRVLVVTPAMKLGVAFVLSLIGYIFADWFIGRLIGSNVATHNAHVFHPYLQNVPRPLHAEQHVNRWGFKGDEIELQKPNDVVRIFFFGGSTVHCGTVPFESTHVRLLEKRLKQEYPDVKLEVQNLAAEWHTTQHDVIKLLFDAREFSPDIVLTFHGINDLVRSFESDLFAEGEYRQDYRHYFGAVANLARPNKTARKFFNTAAGHWCSDFRFQQVRLAGPEGKGVNGILTMFFPKSEPVEITHWRSLPAFERNLREFVRIAKEADMEVVLATQPSLYRNDLSAEDQEVIVFAKSHQFDGKHASLASLVSGMEQFNDTTRKIAAKEDVLLVELDKAMPKTTEYMYDDVHFTRKGNELVAKEIGDALVATRLIPRVLQRRGMSASAAAQATENAAAQSGGAQP